jgi:pyruvate formate lyase activating enzyme
MDCPYCINWELSQPARPGAANSTAWISPAEIVSQAENHACESIAFSYTEPAVFFEYVLETAQLAKPRGLSLVMKTNGFISHDPLAELTSYLDAANVDLKSFRETTYRKLGGHLQTVLETLRTIRAAGVWLEVTTLIVPGMNDSADELSAIARFIADELNGVPWHILRFFPGYRMTESTPTPMDTLNRALDIGRAAGLSHVYLSNLRVSETQNTHCPGCGNAVITRSGTTTLFQALSNGRCQHCRREIIGMWN